ncbi:hypothetical protein B0H12DRAFT_450198 [Mycena haematopus]|nr:hypothetical protein B0H12DRAFT_450198 [Mycena haematopus]
MDLQVAATKAIDWRGESYGELPRAIRSPPRATGPTWVRDFCHIYASICSFAPAAPTRLVEAKTDSV